jgi:mono/diheme cytochrome c family protein
MMRSRLKKNVFLKQTSVRVLAAATLTATLAVGCGPAPPLKFTPSETTQTLIPEVRDGMTVTAKDGKQVRLAGVNDLLAEHFGTPAAPEVWTVLPIDFGGQPAAVAKVVSPSAAVADEAKEDEKPLDQITITVQPSDEQAIKSVPTGAQVAWTKGKYKGRSFRVANFDPKAGAITLAGKFDEGLPKEGDKVLVDAGGVLQHGQELYAHHCIHCHGPGGAGDGPTAKYLNPKPRDDPLGKFKFTSTAGPEKASSEDLLNILKQGIPGTSMPAFRLLSDEDLHALVEYVRWLSMRGEDEIQLATTAASYETTQSDFDERIADGDSREEILEDVQSVLEDDLPGEAEVIADGLSESWENADDPSAIVEPSIPRVADTPESRARGRALYLSDKAKCASCHGAYGKGDGPQTYASIEDSRTKQPYPVLGLHDDWHNPIRPRDLTQGVYRGGRRPIDIYRRIHSGIKGTPMPRFDAALMDEEIWDIVNYVLNAPYEPVPEPGKGEKIASSGH